MSKPSIRWKEIIGDEWLVVDFIRMLENYFLILLTGEQKWRWMVFGQMIRQPALRSEALSGWQRWITRVVSRKHLANKEPVSWNTGQRQVLGCLRLVPANPHTSCVYIWVTLNIQTRAALSRDTGTVQLSGCKTVKIVRSTVVAWPVFMLKMSIPVFCLVT